MPELELVQKLVSNVPEVLQESTNAANANREAMRQQGEAVNIAAQSATEGTEHWVRLNGVLVNLNATADQWAGTLKRNVVPMQTEAKVATVEEEKAIMARGAAMKDEITQRIIQSQVTQESTSAQNANTEAVARSEKAHSMFSDATRVHVRDMRIMKFEAMEAAMGIQFLSMMLGDALPGGAQKAAKEMNLVIEGMMGGMFIAGPAGAAVGALAGSVMVLGKAFEDLDITALNKELEKVTGESNQAATGLAKLSGATREDAEAALSAAKGNREYAESLQNRAKAAEETQKQHSLLNQVLAKTPELRIFSVEGGKEASTFTDTIGGVVKQIEGLIPASEGAKAEIKALDDQIAVGKELEGYKDLNQQLDSLGKKSDVVAQFSRLTGETREQAEAVLKLAGQDKELGGVVAELTKQIEADSVALKYLNAETTDAALLSSRLAYNERELADAISKAKYAAAEKVEAKEAEGIAQDKAKASADAANEQIKYSQDVAKAERSSADESARAWREFGNQIREISYQRGVDARKTAEEMAKADQSYRDQTAKDARTLNDSLAKEARSLADTESDANRSLRDKEADHAWDYQKKVKAVDDEILKQKRDLADKELVIQRTLQEDLNKASFTDALSIQKAKTENERGEIELRAAHERGSLYQRASDQMSDAERAAAERESESKKKRAQEEDDYRHTRDINRREFEEKLADARRSNAEQAADARQRYQEQVADAALSNQRQKESLAQRLIEENAALDHQMEVARQRYAQTSRDHRTRLQTEIADIGARHDYEVQRTLQTLHVATMAHEEKMRQGREELGLYAGGQYLPPSTSHYVGVTGRQAGGQTLPGQTYLVGEHGPELLRMGNQAGNVVPMSQVSNSFGGHTFNVNIATNDPAVMWSEFRRLLQEELFRPNAGSSFVGR